MCEDGGGVTDGRCSWRTASNEPKSVYTETRMRSS